MIHKTGKTIAIIQARLGSTRLPGKVLKNLSGQPMLLCVVNRAKRAATLDNVVIATTVQSIDDAIAALCRKQNIPCFRGSENDVLDRYYQTASRFNADIIVRITSDCPLIEPEIIDKVVTEFKNEQPVADYVSNTLKRSYPRGLDTEVFSFSALKRAWQEDNNPAWREHVTQYIIRHLKSFKTHNVENGTDYSHMRWTVDTMEDLKFVRKIYNYFKNDTFGWREVLQLLRKHPIWMEINRNVQQKPVP